MVVEVMEVMEVVKAVYCSGWSQCWVGELEMVSSQWCPVVTVAGLKYKCQYNQLEDICIITN